MVGRWTVCVGVCEGDTEGRWKGNGGKRHAGSTQRCCGSMKLLAKPAHMGCDSAAGNIWV